MMGAAWKPSRDEAQFLGEIVAIDASLAATCADLLRTGSSLTSVRASLGDALRIVRMARGERP